MKKDFLGTAIHPDRCIACEIAEKNYMPPGGGVLFEDDYFIIHQDPYVAIPGFLIVSPRRHIYTMDNMQMRELQDLGRVIAMAESAVRKIDGVRDLTVIQEETIEEGHLHIWIFPWYGFYPSGMGHSLGDIREITKRYRFNRQYQQETLQAAENIKEFLAHSELAHNTRQYSGLTLCNQNFSGKDLSHADFSGAVLKRCKFDNCELSFANFDNADLYRASFCGATMYSATFKGADLTRADFRKARLYGIKIFGADLSHTVFDETVREEEEGNFARAEDIYNTIKRAYTENGNKEEAAKYYYKQCVSKRKQKSGFARFFNWLIEDFLIGYGEKLTRCLVLCVAVMLCFGLLYSFLTGGQDIIGCLLSSLALFFGFDPVVSAALTEQLKIWCVVEQVVGYFLIALALIGIARKIVRD